MKYLSKILFIAASAVLIFGMSISVSREATLGSAFTSFTNTYYMLGTALFIAAAAAELIWGARRTA